MKYLSTWTLIWMLATSALADENWPRFRGPHATGVAKDDPRLPMTWSDKENVLWKTDVPGWGWASPVVWGDKVFVTSVHADSEYEKPKKGLYNGPGRAEPPKGKHHWMVYCLSLETGKLLWKHEAHQGQPTASRHPKSTYASETPTTDGERLYVLFGDLGLFCYDLQGKPLWSQRIKMRKTMSNYGAAASPIVHKGLVVMVYDNMEESYIVGLDAKTGKQKWRTKREEPSSWATPYLWENEHRTEIVVPGRNRNRSYDLQGNVLWEFNGRMSVLTIPSPFASDGLLYITSGYFARPERPAFAIAPGASGDITLAAGETKNEFIRWAQAKAGPYNTSPLVYRGRYYTLLDRGMFTIHDAKTGEMLEDRVRFKPRATFTASPWAYNGKVFCLSEDGDTFVLDAADKFKLERINSLNDLCVASPAIVRGKLLIRSASKLYCIGKKK